MLWLLRERGNGTESQRERSQSNGIDAASWLRPRRRPSQQPPPQRQRSSAASNESVTLKRRPALILEGQPLERNRERRVMKCPAKWPAASAVRWLLLLRNSVLATPTSRRTVNYLMAVKTRPFCWLVEGAGGSGDRQINNSSDRSAR